MRARRSNKLTACLHTYRLT